MDMWTLKRAEKLMERDGYWYPPDAYEAVAEGRNTYKALDPAIEWPISHVLRHRIQQALTASDSAAR